MNPNPNKPESLKEMVESVNETLVKLRKVVVAARSSKEAREFLRLQCPKLSDADFNRMVDEDLDDWSFLKLASAFETQSERN